MKPVTLCAALLALAALATACRDATAPALATVREPGATVLAKHSGGGGSGGGGLPTVSLTVTMSTSCAAGPCNIQSDGNPYVNGQQNVKAVLDQYGNFIFDSKASGKPAQRYVTYDFSSPVDPSNTYAPSTMTTSGDYHFATAPSATSPYTAIQNLTSSECVALGGGIPSSTGSGWHVSFHRGTQDNTTTQSSYAVITRTSSTTWTVEPVAACGDSNTGIGALLSADESTFYGYYNLPFSFTLTAN